MVSPSTYVPAPGAPLRVLFVDDEPDVLRGIERSLFSCDSEQWEFDFASSGEEALELFAEDPFDVVVSDMRMPGIDGVELLQRVAAARPGTLRMILSGHTEIQAAMRAMPVAHQFLSKPTQSDELLDTIVRGFRLRQSIGDPKIQAAAGGVDFLPPRPKVYGQVMQLLAADDVSLSEVGRVVSQDLSISVKLLQVANNAFFNRGVQVTSIAEAVTRLGPRIVRDIALSTEAFGSFKLIRASELEALTMKAFVVATIARELAESKPEKDLCFSAGLLHDVGHLIMLWKHRRRYVEVGEVMKSKRCTRLEAEKEVLGVTHAELGAHLLGMWGLPYPVVECVLYHHQPTAVRSKLLSRVYVAEVAFQAMRADGDCDDSQEEQIEALGLLELYAEALVVAQSDEIQEMVTNG